MRFLLKVLKCVFAPPPISKRFSNAYLVRSRYL